jgi:hypothetical protein
MTTTVKIHVNGRYRATVVQTNADGVESLPIVVEGNYEGSPNPSGEYSFHLYHPATASFAVTGEQVPMPVSGTAPGSK